MIKYLLETCKCKTDAKDESGHTPFVHACELAYTEENNQLLREIDLYLLDK